MSASALAPAQEIHALFRRHFGYTPPHTVSAPGRIELLGNHTDYNQGLVLALAIDRHIHMAVSPRRDGQVELVTSAFPGGERFSAHSLASNPAVPWANYVKGVLDQLRKRRVVFPGFSAAMHGTIPLGAGLASSAALEVATLLAVRRLSPFGFDSSGRTMVPKSTGSDAPGLLTRVERLEMAKICQEAESQFVGVQCGLLDPLTSLFGKAFHAVEIDCQTLAVETVPMMGEVALVVCDSGVRHTLADGAYNELRAHCDAATKALGVKSLRAVDPPWLAANRKRLSQREHDCAYHIAGENQRVVFGSRALRDGDFEQFGQYLFQSHESSRDFFRNSCPELDQLVERARLHPACLGARLTGGGFGGSTINLVRREGAKDFCQVMMAAEPAAISGSRRAPVILQPADGAVG